MKYYYLLAICGQDWQEKINLGVFENEPTKDDMMPVIKDYWKQYEEGGYENFEEFMEYLKKSSENTTSPWRKGYWIEKIAFFDTKDKITGA
jgi:hypothetical protein